MGMIKWLRAKAARARRHGDEAAKAIEDTANELSANSAMTDEAEHDDELPEGDAQAGGLDFVAAIRAHQAWKGRLLSYVQGQSSEAFDAIEVSRDDACELGHWLHGPGCQTLEDPSLLPELTAAHAQFHQLAGRIVQAMQAGDTGGAHQLMVTEYHRASVRMQGKLAELFLSAAPTESSSPTP